MAAQIDIITAMQALIASALPGLPEVVIGQLPKNGGISAQITAGYNDAVYLNKAARQVIPVLLLAKHKKQQQAAGWLFDICNTLQSMTEYPSAAGWALENVTTATTPGFVSQEEGGLWLYSAIINLEFTLKE